MLEQRYALLAGLIAACVLTPLCVRLFQVLLPPQAAPLQVSNEKARAKVERLFSEAAIGAVAVPIVSALVLGFGTPVDRGMALMIVGGILAVPPLWVHLNATIISRVAPSDVSQLFESKYHVSYVRFSRFMVLLGGTVALTGFIVRV